MSPRPLDIHPDAVEEAMDAAEWYEQRSIRARNEFLDDLRRTQQRLVEAPERQPTIYSNCRRIMLERFPYKVIYQVLPDRLLIIAIAHGHRRSLYWRHRR